MHGWTADRARRKAGEIYNTLLRVFELAKEQGIATFQAADRVAEQRIRQVGQLKRSQ
jgi:hypothetical protein